LAGGPTGVPERAPVAGLRRLLGHVALYLALLAGAGLTLLAASLLAHVAAFDLDGSRFGRLLILAVYAIGAIAALLKLGG
jgi:hypothetical protein